MANSHDLSEYEAPPGRLWVCAVCGRVGTNRAKLGDTSCFTHSILCKADSIVIGDGGKVITADAGP